MFIVFVINTLIIAVVVVIHYELLYQSTALMPKLRIRHRFRILVGVFAALTAHILEVWVFALAYWAMDKAAGWGTLSGNYDGTLFSSVVDAGSI